MGKRILDGGMRLISLMRLIPHLHQAKSGTLSVGGRQGRHMQTGYPYATSLEAAFVASLSLAEA